MRITKKPFGRDSDDTSSDDQQDKTGGQGEYVTHDDGSAIEEDLR